MTVEHCKEQLQMLNVSIDARITELQRLVILRQDLEKEIKKNNMKEEKVNG